MSELSSQALFVRVVEDGSFSATARFLGILPSSVSRQISQLEEELGTRLFHRTTRRQHLTETGEIYLQYAQRIVAELDSAKLAVSQLTQAPSGRLTVAIEAELANIFIAPILPAFLQRYPEIQVRFLMGAEFVDLVDSGVDVAIRMGHLGDSNLFARKIATSQSFICASPEYLERHGTPQHPKELSSHNCLSFRTQPGNNNWRFQIDSEISDIPIKGSVNANNLVLLRNLALAGVGIIMSPTWMIREELTQKTLVPILQNYPTDPQSTPMNALFAHNRHMAPKVRAFIDYLVEEHKTPA